MIQNVGKGDRLLRLVLGFALIVAALGIDLALFENSAVKFGAVAVGGVFVLTALFRFCPLYRLVGMNTCRV